MAFVGSKHLLLRHLDTGCVIETPQFYLLRMACSIESASARAALTLSKTIGTPLPYPRPRVAADPLGDPVVERNGSSEAPLPFRSPPGMAQAVAERTILRKDAGGD